MSSKPRALRFLVVSPRAMSLVHAWSALLLLTLGGCAQIVSIKPAQPQFAAAVGLPIESGNLTDTLAVYLNLAYHAGRALDANPRDGAARQRYNFAVARVIATLKKSGVNLVRHSIRVPIAERVYTLSAKAPPGPETDPANYELVPVDTIRVGGTYFRKGARREGVGAPFVAILRGETSKYLPRLGLDRVFSGVTAMIRFEDGRAEIEFLDPLAVERARIFTRRYPLAADFTAPLALFVARERPQRLGLIRLLRPERYTHTTRLMRLQPFDPERIPVIFIHGLQDTSATWMPMITSLLADPKLRRHYQFWVFSYPSGYPYPYSAALLRQELDAVVKAFPEHKPVTLVGHSMGGLIAQLMVTDADGKLWRELFGRPPAQSAGSRQSRQLLERLLIFDARPEVRRVIFISTPHRGSELAGNWLGRLASSLIRMPNTIVKAQAALTSVLALDPARKELAAIPNSIDTLDPDNNFVRAVNELPIARGVRYHSIIGDRGRGDTPQSSDGIVPYWSSHLAGARSELIVPSGHNAHQNPQAIAEVRRILRLDLRFTRQSSVGRESNRSSEQTKSNEEKEKLSSRKN